MPPSAQQSSSMPSIDNLLADMAARRKEERHKKIFESVAPPKPPIEGLALVIHIRTCRRCGREEKNANQHLLATYREPGLRLHKEAYEGPIPADVPLTTEWVADDNGPDWCEACFPPREG